HDCGFFPGLTMNFSRPAPPIATCLLPGPWQDSHPLPPAIFPVPKSMRACGLAGNARVMFPWQSAHALSPTNVAPSVIGGATTVLSTVAHELPSKMSNPIPADTPAAINEPRALSHNLRIAMTKSLLESRIR